MAIPSSKKSAGKFRYEHPDIVRRYLAHSPCEKCKHNKTCDTPCDAYLNWYDARIAYARKKAKQ